MRISFPSVFALIVAVLVIVPAGAHAVPKRNAIRVGGIAGNHPYFYRGSTGQAWSARHPVAYRPTHCIPFKGDGRRIVVVGNPWWYGYGYGYGGYGWGDYGYSSYDSQPVYQQQQPATRIVVVRSAPPQPQPDAWSLLKAGQYNDAVGRFAIDAQRGSAGANVGYAIASALAGRHGDAAWAMRRALEQDPAALRSSPALDMRGRLDALAADYESGAARPAFADDRWFLLAALHHLRGDADAAKAALAKVKDDEKSTAALRSLLP